MDARRTEGRQPGAGGEGRRFGIGRALRAPPRPEDNVTHDQRRDIVEKQSGDRLVDQLRRAQQSRQQRPQRAAEEAERGHQRDQRQGRPMGEAERARGRKQPAHIELPLPADIDEAETARRGDRDRGQEQRRHAHEQLRESVSVGEHIDDRVAIGAQRVLAVDEQKQREDRRRRDDHNERAPRGRSGGAEPGESGLTRHRPSPPCRRRSCRGRRNRAKTRRRRVPRAAR